MDALVSGVAARVVFLYDSEVFYIDADRPTERHFSNRIALPYLLSGAHDVEKLSGVTEKQAFDVLLRKWNTDRALRMLQIALDSGEYATTREEAASYLSSLLREQDVRGGIENTAFSFEFHDGIDTKDLESHSWQDPEVSKLLGKLIAHQPEIATVRRAWDLLPDLLFGGRPNRCRAELVAISTGAFRELAETLKVPANLEGVISDCTFKLRSQPNCVEIVQQWTKNLADMALSSSAPIDENFISRVSKGSVAVTSYNIVKRTVDIAVIILVAPAALIAIGAAALAILVYMGRPTLFAQERVGLNGRVFKMFKLRTMRRVDHNVKTATATAANDPRITPLGRFLRRFHIDELPQLWNILRGEMTLIGPRPEQVHLVELYRNSIPNFDYRHMVKPGLSGWAQVRYGYATDANEAREKLQYDLFYLRNFGPALDLQIALQAMKNFLKFVACMLRGRGPAF